MNRLHGISTTCTTKLGSWRWPDHSRVFVVTDNAGWSLDWDAKELKAIFRRVGAHVAPRADHRCFRRQSVFHTSRGFLLNEEWMAHDHRVAFPYYHGVPGTGYREFDQVWEGLVRCHDRICRVQTTNSQMHRLILKTGIDPAKVFLIPIGINLGYFPKRTPQERQEARNRLGIPENAYVVGSFQKDGNGWGEGNEPKLIKGPDVFVEAMRLLKKAIPELCVVLSGPARGFVKRGLTQNDIPFVHCFVNHYPDVADLYKALDLYVVASRQEGGPKAILESMATGVPLISTRVGQAADLVIQGQNGWLVDVDDAEAIAGLAAQIHSNPELTESVVHRARESAEANSYEAQHPLWRMFLTGFVEFGHHG